MEKKLTYFFGVGLSASLLAWPLLVAAGSVQYLTQQPVIVNGYTLQVLVNSQAVSISVDSASLTAVVGAGDTFTILDNVASRRLLFKINGDPSSVNATFCNSNQSYVTFSPTSQTTYLIEPQTTTCATGGNAVGSGSSGSPGGGGSPSPVPAPAPTLPYTPRTSPVAVASAGVHPNGTLINDNGTIYLVVNGKKRGFRNPAEYLSYGYNFNQAVPASAGDQSLASDNSMPIAKALDGTLALDHGTIFMIANGKKRGFTSAKVFKALGYKFSQAKAINLADYPEDTPISDPKKPHPDGALVVDKKGTVWWILGGMRQGFESATVFYTYGFSFKNVVSANAADLALVEGARVKFRDGTLVKDGTAYFLISDGNKRSFASIDVLTNMGYKTSNAISASLANYTQSADIR